MVQSGESRSGCELPLVLHCKEFGVDSNCLLPCSSSVQEERSSLLQLRIHSDPYRRSPQLQVPADHAGHSDEDDQGNVQQGDIEDVIDLLQSTSVSFGAPQKS